MPARQSYQQYTVVKGDTLSAIAARFGSTVSAIAVTSGIADPNKIAVGQVLSIPVASTYDPSDLDLSEVQVTAKLRGATPISAPKTDPRTIPNTAPGTAAGLASWFQPPKLWFTVGILATVAFAIMGGRSKR